MVLTAPFYNLTLAAWSFRSRTDTGGGISLKLTARPVLKLDFSS